MKKGIETKERIIRKALNLFHEKGYNLTSMNDIVDETGVKKGNLYFHYNSKEKLVVEVLKEALREYDSFITSRMHGLTPLSRLISMIQAIVAYHVEKADGRGCIFGNMALESKDGSFVISGFVESVFAAWERNIAELIKNSINAGEISGIDSPECYARVVIAQLEGAVMLSKVYSGYAPLMESSQMIVAELKKKMQEGIVNAD